MTYEDFEICPVGTTAKIRRLEEALRFYATEERYSSVNRKNDGTDPYTPADAPYYQDIGRDYGAVARAALTE